MKVVAFLIIFALSSTACTPSAPSKNVKHDPPIVLQKIESYPVKIDGCCGFFTQPSLPITENNSMLIISPGKRAFVQVDKKVLLFKRTKRTRRGITGHVDYYNSEDGKLILTIDSISSIGKYKTLQFGSIDLKHGNLKIHVKVHGTVDFDNY